MVVVEVQFCLLDFLQLQIALGQTGVCLHFFEFERVLAVLLLDTILYLPNQFVLDGLLESRQILFLVLYAAFKLSLQVVEFSYFMGDACFTLPLTGSLRHHQSTLECFEGIDKVDLDQFFCFFDVYFDQLLPNQPHHLCALLLVVERAGTVEGILEDLDGFIAFLALVVTFTKAQECDELVLLVLGEE